MAVRAFIEAELAFPDTIETVLCQHVLTSADFRDIVFRERDARQATPAESLAIPNEVEVKVVEAEPLAVAGEIIRVNRNQVQEELRIDSGSSVQAGGVPI